MFEAYKVAFTNTDSGAGCLSLSIGSTFSRYMILCKLLDSPCFNFFIWKMR